nr:isoform 2 of arogenate dehydratase/prephenate dehydratase 1, chloroplastic [Quercus suber]
MSSKSALTSIPSLANATKSDRQRYPRSFCRRGRSRRPRRSCRQQSLFLFLHFIFFIFLYFIHKPLSANDLSSCSKDGSKVRVAYQGLPGAYSGIERTQGNESRGFHKDLNLLPKHLSANDLSSCSKDGSKVRVAYQGFPGAYSEAAALKAYPKCETVPRDQFEEAFKVHIVVITYFIAIELWLVDKAILPIENSVGGSIHRNYDLLLRHRLNIVGKVQLQVNHCLLGLSGVRKEEIKNVLSHPQFFLLCQGCNFPFQKSSTDTFQREHLCLANILLLLDRVTIGTWNVAGRLPCEDLEIDDWLCTEEPADIYILGCSKTLYWTKNEFSQLKRKFETVVQILLEARTIYPNLSKLGLALEKS